MDRLGTGNIEMKKKEITGQKNRQDRDTYSCDMAVSVGRGVQRCLGAQKKKLCSETRQGSIHTDGVIHIGLLGYIGVHQNYKGLL